MSIIRSKHNRENPYVQINRKALWDKNLSLAAIGLWARLLSKPDDWEIHISQIAKSCGCSVRIVYRLVNELIENGYASRSQEMGKGKKGFSSVVYEVYEFKINLTHVRLTQRAATRSAGGYTTKRDPTNQESRESKDSLASLPTCKKNPPPLPPPKSESASDQSLESWKKKKISSNACSKEEMEEALTRLYANRSNGVKNVRKWLETTIQSIQDQKCKESQIKAIQEARYGAARANVLRKIEEVETQDRQKQIRVAKVCQENKEWLSSLPESNYVLRSPSGEGAVLLDCGEGWSPVAFKVLFTEEDFKYTVNYHLEMARNGNR